MTSRVVVAIDSFKGTITATDAALALADGWRSVRPEQEIVLRPMADGGEGTLESFATAAPGSEWVGITVTGPEGTPIAASWLLLPATPETPHGTGVVELARVCGIELLGSPPRLRAQDAHTVGLGEAIADALAHGVSRLIVGLGSSASTDGGCGMLTALGARITDAEGLPVRPGGRGLADIADVDLSGLPPLPPAGVTVLTDVTNPLTGPTGAAAVFGPQKGADAASVAVLEDGLDHLARFVPVDPATPGAGAAGGAGFALLAWGAHLVPGSSAVAALIGLEEAVAGASVVVTGEGAFDGQSAAGKVPSHVAAVAAAAGVPAALVAGRISPDADTTGFAAALSLTDLAGSPEAAMAGPARWLGAAGARLASDLEV